MKRQIIKIRRIFLVISILLLGACGEIPKRWDPQAYTVKRGDTLYSIAWRYEKDYRQLALWNNIQSPYAIYPGQRLRMQAANNDGTITLETRPQVLTQPDTGSTVVIEAPSQAGVSHARKTYITVQKYDTLYAIARREGYSHHQLARWNRLQSPYLLKPGKKLRLSPPLNSLGGRRQLDKESAAPLIKPLTRHQIKSRPLAANDHRATKTKNTTKIAANKKSLLRVDKWQWPAPGRIVQTFKPNDTSRKGIEISGKLGQAVKAAASGTVVYSGNGLINYGNLVIIKHSHTFLSAYAYNKSLLVKEGDTVKRGQSIAKMGQSNSTKPQLHFEIRRNGKPVNPLHYLPKS